MKENASITSDPGVIAVDDPLIRLGIYKHFKGHTYEVICASIVMDGTREPCVVYRPLYGDKKLTVRTLANFTETVTTADYEGPRFVFEREGSDLYKSPDPRNDDFIICNALRIKCDAGPRRIVAATCLIGCGLDPLTSHIVETEPKNGARTLYTNNMVIAVKENHDYRALTRSAILIPELRHQSLHLTSNFCSFCGVELTGEELARDCPVKVYIESRIPLAMRR